MIRAGFHTSLPLHRGRLCVAGYSVPWRTNLRTVLWKGQSSCEGHLKITSNRARALGSLTPLFPQQGCFHICGRVNRAYSVPESSRGFKKLTRSQKGKGSRISARFLCNSMHPRTCVRFCVNSQKSALKSAEMSQNKRNYSDNLIFRKSTNKPGVLNLSIFKV